MRTKKKQREIGQFISNPKNRFLIYGPTPYLRLTPWLKPGMRVPLGTIHLSKSVRRVELELGRGSRAGGRLTGVGHSNGDKKDDQGFQWFRMDWHSLNGHGPESNDRERKPYHFHTQTAP